MAEETYTPLLSEVLTKVNNAKNKGQKIKILKENNCLPLRQILIWAFDPNVISALPSGKPPFIENDAPEGTEHTTLRKESNNLYRFVKGGDDNIEKSRKENMFIQLLEGLHKDEAELLCNVKDKQLHKVYKGLSKEVVKEGLGLDDNFKVI
tara:strand:- start:21 stop:473 length:453 start_codon:yes stop_codon:yes gene_type:complete